MSVLSLWPYQPELSFIDRLCACWRRMYPGHPCAEDAIDTEWFTNETRNVSCMATISPLPSGGWRATLVSRTGYSKRDFSYSFKSITQPFSSRIEALRAAEQLAKQFVHLRHRYYHGTQHLACVPAA
ncbi:hypothetical protein I5M92_22225 [Serratia marcescens]|uniref:hypothetical protein n=1 Tax=Serratia marcescens TaxID=615 RepID=UPI000A36A2DA|nr:hypothetical protein [Serratia marcescens]MBH3072796.1 hypothetical protein [Serratia marcescens]OUI68944.1 hypothetical protein AZZ99_003235 [Serratia marcescens]HEJ0329790.1 hypothetical protein [Serratia marcescens]